MKIEVITQFDGACPHFPENIRQESPNHFVFYPGRRKIKGVSEESGLGSGARFSARIVNHAENESEMKVTVDWEACKIVYQRDFGYVRHESETEWTMIPGTVKDAKVDYQVKLRPGLTHLGLYPEYSYEQCCGFAKKLQNLGVNVSSAGKSREGRNVWLATFNPNDTDNERPAMLVQTRDHAYETAGSYCSEGVAEFLLSGEPLAYYLLNKYEISMLPMSNPDGVFNGMSRLTWENGADMNRILTVEDSAHTAVKSVVDRLRPVCYMNVHNYQMRFSDGIYVNEDHVMEKFPDYFARDVDHFKAWDWSTTSMFVKAKNLTECPEDCKSWKNYVREQFGGIGINFEFPWFALNTADMKDKGKRAFTALALLTIEEKKL